MVENKRFTSNKVIIFGTGQIAEEVTNYLRVDSKYEVIAFTVDKKYMKKKTFMKKPVISFETIAQKLNPKNYVMFVAIGYTNLNQLRYEKILAAKKKGYKLISYVSSRATIMGSQKIKENSLILENTTIQTTAELGSNIFIWSNNLIGHHVKIKNNSYIAGNSTIAGSSILGEFSFMGINSCITHGVKIGKSCFVGANAFVNKDMQSRSISISEASRVFKINNTDIIKKIIR